MKTPLFPHSYTDFFQFGYVVRDLTQAMELFSEKYGIKHYLEAVPLVNNVIANGKIVEHNLLVSFANIGSQQIELIQPIADGSGTYSSHLAQTSPIFLHHLGCRFMEKARWDAFRSNLDTDLHPIAFENADGNALFIYTNELSTLGHHLEYMWLDDEASVMFDSIPQNC